ncbi:nitronate monooxygenase [Variovorax sp. CF079]|nr:nitronate monooxygenase [Variovorax sp. CF079]
MLHVSGPELVVAACRAGAIGAFPTANCRSEDELSQWIARIRAAFETAGTAATEVAPFCANLIVRSPHLQEHLACLVRERVEMVITSVGSPRQVVGPLRDAGCRVFADVATLAHAEKALADGVDGLVLVTAGAGGQTGWVNPFAFVRAVRSLFDGPLVLAGGIADGHALWAACALGADLAYMGTRFIATPQSMASPVYRQMLVQSTFDDVMTSAAFSGLDANWLRPSIVAAGLDPDALAPEAVRISNQEMYDTHRPRRWTDLWSAGHSVVGVQRVQDVADLVNEVATEFNLARERSMVLPAAKARSG